MIYVTSTSEIQVPNLYRQDLLQVAPEWGSEHGRKLEKNL